MSLNTKCFCDGEGTVGSERYNVLLPSADFPLDLVINLTAGEHLVNDQVVFMLFHQTEYSEFGPRDLIKELEVILKKVAKALVARVVQKKSTVWKAERAANLSLYALSPLFLRCVASPVSTTTADPTVWQLVSPKLDLSTSSDSQIGCIYALLGDALESITQRSWAFSFQLSSDFEDKYFINNDL